MPFPVLKFPDYERGFIVHVDASAIGVGDLYFAFDLYHINAHPPLEAQGAERGASPRDAPTAAPRYRP